MTQHLQVFRIKVHPDELKINEIIFIKLINLNISTLNYNLPDTLCTETTTSVGVLFLVKDSYM